MQLVKTLAIMSLVATLAACSTTSVALKYDPSSAIKINAHPVAVENVTDSRKHGANWLGAIRGGFGNPLKTLETSQPVSEVVETALIDGLKARGMFAENNPQYTIQTNMLRFDSNQVGRREAHISLDVSVVNSRSQEVVFSKNVTADAVNGSIITLDAGVFASVEDLRVIANDVLQEAIDKLLDDPQFQKAIRK